MAIRWGFGALAVAVSVLFVSDSSGQNAGPIAEHRPTVVPGLSEIDEPITLLEPRQARTEEETDQIDALAFFAAARTAEDQGDLAESLRLYQRAYRRHPGAVAPLRQIVPLAFRLDRQDSALRYAVKLAEQDDTDLPLLRNLATLLIEQGGDDQAAARLLEKAAEQAAKSDEPGDQYLHLIRLVRVYRRLGDDKKAAAALVKVEDALAAREEHKLTDGQVEDLLAEPGRSDEAHGEIYLAAGEFDRARAAFDRAYAATEDIASIAFRAAQIAAKSGNDAEALKELDRYFAANKLLSREAPYRLLAEIYSRQNRQAELIAKLESLKSADAPDPSWSLFLAEQYLAAEKWDLAQAIYQRLSTDPEAFAAARGLAEIYQRTKQPKPLLDLLAKAAAGEPGLEMLGPRVEKLAADAEIMDLLIAEGRERVNDEERPLGYGGAFTLALLALEAKRLDVAGEFFELAIDKTVERKAQTVMAWGLGLLMAEDYAGATKAFQRGVDDSLLPAGNPTFHYYLAGTLEMSGETDKALAEARQAAESADRAPRLAGREAWILYHARRYDEAKRAYEAVVARFDDEYSASEYRDTVRDARLALSNLCVIEKNFPAAEEWLEQVLDEFPDDIGASNDLGYLWADQNKRLNRSLAMLQFAVAKAPENAAYRDSLGWALYRLGRHAEALPEIERSAAQKDADGVILDHLGDVHQALGHADQAKEAWTKAVAAFERDKEAEQAEMVRKKLAP